MSRGILAAVSLLILVGCASGGASRAGHRGSSGNLNVITAQELEASTGLANALEAVRRLRPQFLQAHGATTLGATGTGVGDGLPTVFVGNQKYGSVNTLRDILLSDVQEIRYLSAGDATQLWGTGYTSGVIQVIRKSS